MKYEHRSYEACRRGDCRACQEEERLAELEYDLEPLPVEPDPTYDPYEPEPARQT